MIAYALIALTLLLVLALIARSHLRRRPRSPKHLRIDLLSKGEAGERRESAASRGGSNLP
jgi:hypothetical protein